MADEFTALDWKQDARRAVANLLKQKGITNPRFVGWVDKINRRDQKVLKRVLVITDTHVLTCKAGGKIAREGKIQDLRAVSSSSATQLTLTFKGFVIEAESTQAAEIFRVVHEVHDAADNCRATFQQTAPPVANGADGGGGGGGDVGSDYYYAGGGAVADANGTLRSRKETHSVWALKEGWLHKQGAKRKNWKKRWFVLNKTSLNYYESQKDARMDQPIGSILVTTIRDGADAVSKCDAAGHDKQASFVFALDTKDRR
eukprot:CAMPEP_0198324618 /NCGR_PEP_ID=MMETSP1450-20131203/12589_1 /TAXON_ID=753684 ORGANISM="Madagascaria erythrocladiodes, Strain CCMP3234" /NCGR_SAMPLE_ID=MMETSP1450 /ASSEMBLY_ACC=CAM_ASM_001115 /LENGTH=257 /DNA_ID=CAMNT_0044028429 /DNA_START=39 /DNA_END=808 /DNA_ORIENTATION=+